MSLLRRRRAPECEDLRSEELVVEVVEDDDYVSKEGVLEWAGPWRLDPQEMTWSRGQYFYTRNRQTGKVERQELVIPGPRVRPGPLFFVRSLMFPMMEMRSHPDQPSALPEQYEGRWLSLNPGNPTTSIERMNRRLDGDVAALWGGDITHELSSYYLKPEYVQETRYEPAQSIDHVSPRRLEATVVYFANAEQ